MGDGFVFVKGKIVSESGERLSGCELALLLQSDNADFSIARGRYYVYPVNFEFEIKGISISPARNSYYFMVLCPGYSEPYKSEIYVFDGMTYIPDPLDLGTIVMK